LRKLLTLIVILAAGTLTAHADTIFNLYADFPGFFTIQGTLTIDLATGVVTADTAQLYPPGSTIGSPIDSDLFQNSSEAGSGEPFSYTVVQTEATGTGAPYVFDLTLPVASLIDYSGGEICSAPLTQNACHTIVFQQLQAVAVADSGYLEPATSPVPEPSSLALLGTGLLAAYGIASRRRVHP
jgi:hypothetical protein